MRRNRQILMFSAAFTQTSEKLSSSSLRYRLILVYYKVSYGPKLKQIWAF
ncbi:hypothetical protein Hanom_Chr11g01044811 [Helianthus anomalus]